MTYILTAQLYDEETGGGAFARYQDYIASVRNEFPAGAYALATSDWYYRFSDHRAPHDAWLEEARVTEAPPAGDDEGRRVSILIRLLGAYHDGHIEFHYRDVSRYRMDLQASGRDIGRGHRDWRHDEFRLAPGGRLEHEIEWWGTRSTGTWLIEAADVEYRWIPRTTEDAVRGADA